jgi:hypothetical protein
MKNVRIFHQPILLGTALQHGIHAVLDHLPLPERIRQRVKNCRGCMKRRDALDRLTAPPTQKP